MSDRRVVGLDCLENLSSKFSSEWKSLGRRLGLSEEELDNVKRGRQLDGHGNVCYGVLYEWKKKEGEKATYEVLAKALKQVGRTDLMEDLLNGKFDAPDDTSDDTENYSSPTYAEESGLKDKPKKKKRVEPPAKHLPYYEMGDKERGKCLILTYDEFRDGDEVDEELNRPGNDVDTKNLEATFKQLGFHVEVHTNLDKEDTMHYIKKMAKQKSHCAVLFVCSHGNEESFSTSDNEEIALQDVIRFFNAKKCPGFAGKPKIFFFNSCRGEREEKMAKLKDSQPNPDKRGVGANLSYYRPTQADFCVVLSTVSGYVSWRDETKGTYFVQHLIPALTTYCKTHHLIDILTMSNDALLHEFQEERKSSGDPDTLCQVPTIISTLTKAVYFVDKKKELPSKS